MSQTRPLVSIALCTYNGAQHLHELLNSLVNQTHPNIELVITDDGSTDSSLDIITKFASLHTFIRYEQNEVNLGYVKNFEKAIGKCQGEFIALADQDDIWDLSKIEIMVGEIGKNALIYHDSELINEQGNTLGKNISSIYNMYSGNQPYPFFLWNCISGHSMLFTKGLLDKIIPLNPLYYHDWQISAIATLNGGVKYIPNVLVKYRQHEANATDILNAKPRTVEPQKKLFNQKSLEFLNYLETKMGVHRSYVQSLLSCFNSEQKIVSKFKLFRLLLTKYELLFFRSKKSRISKINLVKRLVLSKA